MAVEFKKNDRFEDLGTLKEYCSYYGRCKISINNINDSNIVLTIKSSQEIQISLLCSYPLSNIIKKLKAFPEKFESYRILRIKKDNGDKFIRVSQNIDIEANQLLSDEEYDKLTNDLEGNVRISYTICESDVIPVKLFDSDELVAF
jgi:hypothetical protein